MKRLYRWYSGSDTDASASDTDPALFQYAGAEKEVSVYALRKKYAEGLDAVRKNIKAKFGKGADADFDDAWLLRFLVGTTTEKALDRTVAMIEWRKENDLAKIQKEIEDGMKPSEFPFAQEVTKWFPQNVEHKFARDGRPISLEIYGVVDPIAFTEEVTPEMFMIFSIYKVEYMRLMLERLTEKTGNLVRSLVIADLKDLGKRHINMGFINGLKTVSKFPEEHYREQVGQVIVARANMVFTIVWKMVKPVLNARTVAKILILGEKETLEVYDQVCDMNNVPAVMGGSCVCEGGCIGGAGEDRLKELGRQGVADDASQLDAETKKLFDDMDANAPFQADDDEVNEPLSDTEPDLKNLSLEDK